MPRELPKAFKISLQSNMSFVTENSYTRITLGLDIIAKITQGPFAGFHELSIVKHQIDLHDVVTVEDSAGPAIRCGHPSVPLDASNICWKALEAIKRRCGVDKNAIITIEKNIPVLGGLAGGSANGASTLRLLNKLWDLGLTKAQLIELGRSVGMDVPYYFMGNTAFDTEATGILEELPTSLRLEFVLVVPDFGVSTKEAYKNIDYHRIAKNVDKTNAMKKAFLKNQREDVIGNVHNDFELSVFKSNPRLQSIKEKLLDLGCKAAVMSGSGSTMIGVLDAESEKETIQKQIGYTTLFVSSKK
jgi:4-diphosphocytidyl-2-C-methyl-D-erythritol kinase